MKPSIADVLEAIRSQMTSKTNLDVFMGAPDSSTSGIYLYPFHFQEMPAVRNRPTRSALAVQSRELIIRCLLIGNPPGNLEVLSHGLDYLHDHPVMELENEVIRISISNMQAEDLTQIFLASGMIYRLAVGFDVQFTCK